MKYFIGYLGEGDVAKYRDTIITDLVREFGIYDLSRRVPPHLTLRYPFETDGILAVINSIESFLENKKPISFVIDGFGRFSNKEETVYLSVKPESELELFVEELMLSLGDLNEAVKFDMKEFKLHMSIARHLDVETADAIENYLGQLPLPDFQLIFNNVTLFVFRNNKWEVERIFRI